MCDRKKMNEIPFAGTGGHGASVGPAYKGFKMSKVCFITLLLISLLLTTSCTSLLQVDVVSEEAHQRAIEAGIISEVEMRYDREFTGQLAEVQYANIITAQEAVRIEFDTSLVRDLFFEREEVRLTEVFVSLDQVVSGGDVLAIAQFDTRELEEELEILRLSIDLAQQGMERDYREHQNLLDEMIWERDLMTEVYEIQTQNYRIQRQELLMERDLGQQEFMLERYNEQLDELYELLEGDKIIAPFDGVITHLRDVERGVTVVSNEDVVIRMVDPGRMQFVVTDHIGLIRYGDVFPALLERHNFEFEVQVVSDPITTDTREEVYTFVLQPVDREGFWSSLAEFGVEYSTFRTLNITGFPTRHEIHHVLTIPVGALNEYDDAVYVLIYEDGDIKRRFINIGFRDNENVQILSGLEEGQMVVR